jgi:hypothetical protein
MFGLNKGQKTIDMKKIRLLFALSVTVCFTSCYYDKTDELYPTLPTSAICDTTSVTITYTSDIVTIMNQSCGAGNSNCHKSGNTASGINLDNYSEVNDAVLDGSLLGSILHTSGYKPMPQGGGTLDACSINKIKSWINHGALEN